MNRTILILLATLLAPAALAAPVETAPNEPTPGSTALLQANYGKAERDLRATTGEFDAARSINLGIVMGMTGRASEAEKLFNEVMQQESVAIIVANGDSDSSHVVARKALAKLQSGGLGR